MATYYPPVGFSFKVLFEFDGVDPKNPKSAEAGFQEVSGLNVTIETEIYQEGGENRFSHRLPKPVTFQNITLKRGMLLDSTLINWFYDSTSGFKFQPITVHIHLLDEDQNPLESWSLIGAYPVKWNIDPFNSQDGKVVAETIELCYQYFDRQGLKAPEKGGSPIS